MLTFNQFLHVAKLDPVNVRLVRHKPEREHHRAIFDAAIRGDARFADYQDRQGIKQIITQFRAGFVVEPTTKATVFMGVWDQLGEHPAPMNPFSGKPPKETSKGFKTQVRSEFDTYRGRLVIDWGDGERAWVQRADKQDKQIVEIRKERVDPPFPGFTTLRHSLGEIETVPVGWRDALRNVCGIYLLVHRDTGQQYVGSAYGADGFFGRWKSYADGHGGNVGLKELGASADAFDAAILEVVGSETTEVEVLEREKLWKEKLGSKVTGLNRN